MTTDETIAGLDVIFEDEVKSETVKQTKNLQEELNLPTFIFQVDNSNNFMLECVIPENTNTELTALFLHKLNKGQLIELVMKAVLNYGKKSGKPQAEEVLSEWATLISKRKPAVRPLSALRIV